MCIEAYIAGLIDGEGCISVEIKRGIHQLSIIVGMTDANALHVIATRFGNNVRGPYNSMRFGTRPIYNWSASGGKAVEMLETLLPYLVVKRSQAELALTFPLGTSGTPTTDVAWNRREHIAQELKILKRADSLG